MNKFKIPLPPIELQNTFVEILFQIRKHKRLTQQSLQKSDKLFQSLLQKVFGPASRNETKAGMGRN